jgi:hypothetical protein
MSSKAMRANPALKILSLFIAWLIWAQPAPVHSQPAGSYQASCRNSRVANDVLQSSCRDKNGNYHDTSLAQVSRCIGQISNDNGVLRCPSYGAIPAGTYQQKCRNSRVDGDVLYSSCLDTHGAYKDTSLAQVSHCAASSILNDDGALHCSTAAIPGGTYSKSCGRVRIENGSLVGECRKIGGGERSAVLQDFKSCWQGTDIVNVDGFISCEKGDRPAPGGSFHSTCRDLVMNQGVLSAQCLNFHRAFKAASLNILKCQQGVENNDGNLTCGHVSKKPVAPPQQGFSAVEMLNCEGNRHTITVWALGSDQKWSRIGQVESSYVDTLCPGGPAGLLVQLTPGRNSIISLDPMQCNGADDPQNFNCKVDELDIVGISGGPVVSYPVGIY